MKSMFRRMFRSAESSVAEIRNRYEEDVLLRQFGKGEVIGFLIPFQKSSLDGEESAVNHLKDKFEVFRLRFAMAKDLQRSVKFLFSLKPFDIGIKKIN